jgi:hypothetical protein
LVAQVVERADANRERHTRRRAACSWVDLSLHVVTVGFGYFLGCRQLSRTDAERLCQSPYRARRRRRPARLQAGDRQRVQA